MEPIRCDGRLGRCRNHATVAFVLLAESTTIRFARCAEHASQLRRALSRLIRPEQWSEARLQARPQRDTAQRR